MWRAGRALATFSLSKQLSSMPSNAPTKNSSYCSIGGVDPAVIRELSGIYKPFVKAFKELVSNAYDADSESVRIRLADDFKSIEIHDDGRGLTPFEFRNDFTKIGGSYTRQRNEYTDNNRPKIGSKGIGFLAVARYCSRMEVTSTTTRVHTGKVLCNPRGVCVDLPSFFEVRIPRELLAGRLQIKSITLVTSKSRKKLPKRDYRLGDDGVITLRDPSPAIAPNKLEIEYELDCRSLEFNAVIDFDYLLGLENLRDLEAIEDFCAITVHAIPEHDPAVDDHFTRIKLIGLKDFVVREFATSKKQGYVRNIESRSGTEKFLWHLQRSIPVKYELPPVIREKFGRYNLEAPEIRYIDRVVYTGPGINQVELKRPLWGGESEPNFQIQDDLCVEVSIDSEGLIAKGYILGRPNVIYPAEYRGIAVRVRNVQIGPPNFFGAENFAAGAVKAALSQITGEINVLQGIDAIDALNPGRESFYEENLQYKALKKFLIGDRETVEGLLGRVIKGILTRSEVASAIEAQISQADHRRKTLLSLSKAINYLAVSSNGDNGLRRLFKETSLSGNGLVSLPDHVALVESNIAGFDIKNTNNLEEDQSTDFINRIIQVNFNQDRWSWDIFILGEHYRVAPKLGSETDPLCQLDTVEKVIYINWRHPVRQQMNDAAFIKSSVAWNIAYHASQGSVEAMMDLALKIVTFEG